MEFDTKTTIVGHSSGAGVASEGATLNIVIGATSGGWEYECDQRHVEGSIEELKLVALKPVSMPGLDEAVDKGQVGAAIIDDDPDSFPLVGGSAIRYRANAARCNSIAVGGACSQYCTNERCRDMSSPTWASWRRLIRLGRSFLGKPGHAVLLAVGGHLLRHLHRC